MNGQSVLKELALLLARAMYLGMEQLCEGAEETGWEESGINEASAVPEEEGGTPSPVGRVWGQDELETVLSRLARESAAMETERPLRPPFAPSEPERQNRKPEGGLPPGRPPGGQNPAEISRFFERDARRYERDFER